MSEYQHYQFLAMDRPLSDAQVAEVRKLTSRAALTRTMFVNSYQWAEEAPDLRQQGPGAPGDGHRGQRE
ncbi:hypothetical protein [Streptomyces pseudovenezuelae]|uniref:Uncharacterized protein n=1 Tax=Streptomyces pseudovenezuelae TaxID=67350 RepID=A0ABT6M2Y1_9ACTN|nr:hypothetical protein [Streptomyces pseudovenezuelae]MDH6222469.1 hypothetical protein [Streptomyces pseudovenezuelae]